MIREWNNISQFITLSIEENLHKKMENKYNNIEAKLNKLTTTHNKHNTLNNNNTFYPRVINKTNIIFSNEQMFLLQKGLKYNLHHKPLHWINKLALEAETAVQLIPKHNQDIIRYQVAKN